MSFAEVRLESDFIVLGTVGGPQWNTNVVVVNSGFEFRNQNWVNARGQWDFGSRKMTSKELHNTIGFFRARRGKFQGFRFKDHGDYTASATPLTEWGTTTQGVFVNLTATTAQLTKLYGSGSDTDSRKVAKPVDTTIRVYKDAALLVETTDYTVDYTTGIVTFTSPYGTSVLTWSGEFDTPVRFDTDQLKYELIAGTSAFTDPPSFEESYYLVQALPIVEIRV